MAKKKISYTGANDRRKVSRDAPPRDQILTRFDSRSEKSKHRDGFFAGIAYAVIASAFVVSSVLAYWTLQPSDVVTGIETPVKVSNEPVKKGGSVSLPASYCKKLPLEATIKRSFVGETTELFQPEVKEDNPVGCVDTTLEVPLPPQIVPGEYRIKFQATYDINPIKSTTETYISEEFTVIE